MKPLASDVRDTWRNLPPDELERQYNARATVPNLDVLLQRYRSESDAAWAQCPEACTVAYGSHPDETLDIFPVPGVPQAPVLVFVHGGYWRALGREDSSFMAPALRQAGVATVAINYTLAPTARLEEIVDQCRRSLLWLWQHGARHGIAPNRMVLAGSSAGAHLAAMLLSADWLRTTSIKPGAIRGAVLVSGLYDLQPVRHCVPNQWLNMDAQQAEALSPVTQLPPTGIRLAVVAAEQDTQEFKRQSTLYAGLAAHAGCKVQSLEVEARNHFDVIMDWMTPQSELSRATLGLFEQT